MIIEINKFLKKNFYIIVIIVFLFLTYIIYKINKLEQFENVDDNIKTAVKNQYKQDIDALAILTNITKVLVKDNTITTSGKLTGNEIQLPNPKSKINLNGDIEFGDGNKIDSDGACVFSNGKCKIDKDGRLFTNGLSNLPNGWGGGLRTNDLYSNTIISIASPGTNNPVNSIHSNGSASFAGGKFIIDENGNIILNNGCRIEVNDNNGLYLFGPGRNGYIRIANDGNIYFPYYDRWINQIICSGATIAISSVEKNAGTYLSIRWDSEKTLDNNVVIQRAAFRGSGIGPWEKFTIEKTILESPEIIQKLWGFFNR